jgi:hypothetical protein
MIDGRDHSVQRAGARRRIVDGKRTLRPVPSGAGGVDHAMRAGAIS